MPTTLVWFRQDLRTDDQPALQAAARSGRPLLGLYAWPNEGMLTARRRYFIWQSLRDLQARLAECGIPLHVREGNPVQAVAETAAHCRAAEVVCASDGAGQGALRAALEKQGCRLHSVADGLLQPPFQFIRAPYFNEPAFAAFQVAWQAACAEQYAAWQAPAWPPTDLAAQQQRLPENLRTAALPAVPRAVLTISGGGTAARRQLAEFLPRLPYYPVLR
ncbi:MAG: deoxyribodipyrimidine photo-lyase, partial [Eikenella corrodens]|nr:deoxyribodipyrimidine photo-lyase [Eikenella corrodens]